MTFKKEDVVQRVFKTQRGTTYGAALVVEDILSYEAITGMAERTFIKLVGCHGYWDAKDFILRGEKHE